MVFAEDIGTLQDNSEEVAKVKMHTCMIVEQG